MTTNGVLNGLIGLVPASVTHEGFEGKPHEHVVCVERKPRMVKLLMCASSAITSAITLLYLSRYLRRRRSSKRNKVTTVTVIIHALPLEHFWASL
jgi:hypothetical protein